MAKTEGQKERARRDSKRFRKKHPEAGTIAALVYYHKHHKQELARRTRMRKERASNPVKKQHDAEVARRRRDRTYRQSPRNRYIRYLRLTNKRGLVSSLTLEEFMTFWEKPCIFGCPISTVGLDRIDSSKGYSLGNVQSMCSEHNLMKRAHSTSKFVDLCKQVVNYYN